jgi:hypothetical protein
MKHFWRQKVSIRSASQASPLSKSSLFSIWHDTNYSVVKTESSVSVIAVKEDSHVSGASALSSKTASGLLKPQKLNFILKVSFGAFAKT